MDIFNAVAFPFQGMKSLGINTDLSGAIKRYMVRVSPSIAQLASSFDFSSKMDNTAVIGDGFPIQSAINAHTPNNDVVDDDNKGVPLTSSSDYISNITKTIIHASTRARDVIEFSFQNPKSIKFTKIIAYCFLTAVIVTAIFSLF
jgi:hypothetical protein